MTAKQLQASRILQATLNAVALGYFSPRNGIDGTGVLAQVAPEVTFNGSRVDKKSGKKLPDGIELRFGGYVPTEEVREKLKAAGFRFSEPQQMWYALDNEDTKAWVKEFGGQLIDVWDFSTNPQNPLEPEKNYFWAKVRSMQDWKYVPKTARVMVSKEGAPNEFFTKSFAPDLSKEIAAGQVRFQKFFQRKGQDGEGEGGDGEPQPGGEPQPKVGKDLEKHAAKLRAIADGMTKEIKHRLDPPIGKQNKTQRRIRIAAGMREEGVKMLRIQTCLYSVADAIDANVAVSDLMLELNSKADFEALEFEYEYKVKNPNKPFKVPERLVKKGVLTEKQFDELWWELAKLVNAGKTPQSESEAKIRELEEKVRRATDELVGEKIPGFFPTPKTLIERMIEAADIKDGMTIIEPSSGKGDIVYHLVENEPTSKLKLEVWSVEPQGSLTWVQKLRNDLYAEKHEQNPAKYVNGPARIRLVETSLEKYQGYYNLPEFDRVLMNPPFEGGKDIEHVRLCYNMLKPGGILVAIMSIGSFQRSYKKEREFQEWISELEVNGLAFSDTIKNAFNTRDSFNQTGVTVKLVQLYKPSGAKPSSPNDDDDLELIELEAEAQIAITNTNSLTAQKRVSAKGLAGGAMEDIYFDEDFNYLSPAKVNKLSADNKKIEGDLVKKQLLVSKSKSGIHFMPLLEPVLKRITESSMIEQHVVANAKNKSSKAIRVHIPFAGTGDIMFYLSEISKEVSSKGNIDFDAVESDNSLRKIMAERVDLYAMKKVVDFYQKQKMVNSQLFLNYMQKYKYNSRSKFDYIFLCVPFAELSCSEIIMQYYSKLVKNGKLIVLISSNMFNDAIESNQIFNQWIETLQSTGNARVSSKLKQYIDYDRYVDTQRYVSPVVILTLTAY